MLIGTTRKVNANTKLDLTVEGANIETVTNMKYLGLYFDQHLKWSNHIEIISKKVSQKIGVLKRIKQYTNKKTLTTLYNALILSQIDYCSSMWVKTDQKLINKIQILQNRIARIILGKGTRDAYVIDLFKELKWHNVEQRSQYFKATLVFKCIHGLVPGYLEGTFRANANLHHHNTRRAAEGDLYVVPTGSQAGTRSFECSGARLWNSLPQEVKQSNNLNTFMYKLKKHLLTQ